MIRLSYPPSSNKIYTNRKKDGRRLLTKEARAWIKQAYYFLYFHPLRLKFFSRKTGEFLQKETIFSMWVYPPDRRKRDISNLIKIVEDVFVKAQWIKDDRNNVKIHLHKCAPIKPPYVEVSINGIDDICPNCNGTGLKKLV